MAGGGVVRGADSDAADEEEEEEEEESAEGWAAAAVSWKLIGQPTTVIERGIDLGGKLPAEICVGVSGVAEKKREAEKKRNLKNLGPWIEDDVAGVP